MLAAAGLEFCPGLFKVFTSETRHLVPGSDSCYFVQDVELPCVQLVSTGIHPYIDGKG